MHSTKEMQGFLSLVLIIGIWISLGLVLIGGIFYLWQHGSENIQMVLHSTSAYQITVKQIVEHAMQFTPTGIIELGLLSLVATQILRVALLVGFYIKIHDKWFTLFSIFILLVLLYSFIWRT